MRFIIKIFVYNEEEKMVKQDGIPKYMEDYNLIKIDPKDNAKTVSDFKDTCENVIEEKRTKIREHMTHEGNLCNNMLF